MSGAAAFLAALGRAAGKGGSPREAQRALQELFAASGRDEVAVSAEDCPEELRRALGRRRLAGAVFRVGVRAYELAALCELLGEARRAVRGRAASRFLRDRGVRRLRVAPREEAEERPARPPPWLPHPLWSLAAPGRRAGSSTRGRLAAAAHDLKAPLASMCAALELLAGRLGSRLSSEEREFLEIGARNGLLMRRMIEEGLEPARLRPARVEAARLLEACAQCLAPWAKARRVALETRADGLIVQADPDRLLHVLNNLVSNAVKFSPAGARVSLEARREGAQAVFTVRDSGPGLDPGDRERVFQRGIQTAEGRRRGGSGLGLWLAREIVALHGGRIWAESEPGQGAAFSFTLPIERGVRH